MYTSPSLLSNLQWLDGSGNHSLNSPYNPSPTWTNNPFTKTPLHPHNPTSLYTSSATSSFTTSRDGYSSPGREAKESPRLQEAMKAERLSPMGGGGGSFLNLTSAAGGAYPSSPHSHPHMLGPYSSYVTSTQDYSTAALYSSPGAWMSSSSYSPKLRNKMRLSPPGEHVYATKTSMMTSLSQPTLYL